MTLQEIRKKRGYSQSELAELSGINKRSLQDYEQGHKQIASAKGETLYRLSRALKCDIEDILKDSCMYIEMETDNPNMMVERVKAYENAMLKRRETSVHFPIVVPDSCIDVSKFLSRAIVALDNAEFNYKRIDFDDCYMDACCFNLQQSIEYSLEFLVKMTGQQYDKNHDILANINILNRVDYHIVHEKEIRAMASTLYSWESESMYKDSFVAVIEDVEEAFVYARALIAEAQGKISLG